MNARRRRQIRNAAKRLNEQGGTYHKFVHEDIVLNGTFDMAGLRKMIEVAGFSRTEEVSRFRMETEPEAPRRYSVRMGVVRARV